MPTQSSLIPPTYGSQNSRHNFLVYLEDIVVEFDGFKALDIEAIGFNFNDLHVVIGPNGAGKTTLCDVISGKTPPTQGKVFFNGSDITHASDTEIASMGVGRKFQTPTVFNSLTVMQNMELALPSRRRTPRGVWQNLFGTISKEERDQILAILERVRLIEQRDLTGQYLSHGQRQWLEISMLILAGPELLLVDEPAAGLTDSETALAAELLLELKDEHTIVVIEHDMEFVRMLDSNVTVLNEGRVMMEGDLAVVKEDPAVIEAYLGR